MDRRLHEHNKTARGAAYTRARRPVELVYSASFASRSAASQREYQIKRLPKADKELLILPTE